MSKIICPLHPSKDGFGNACWEGACPFWQLDSVGPSNCSTPGKPFYGCGLGLTLKAIRRAANSHADNANTQSRLAAEQLDTIVNG